MAAIREQLTLEDKFSGPLNKFIQKMEQAVRENREFYQTEARMSGETGRLVQELSGLESAIHGAFTDSEADAALARLQKEMEKAGLVWTNEAEQMEAADLIVRVGLRQLAQDGKLSASAMAENAAAAEQAAAAQEKHEERVSRLTGALVKMAGGAKNAVASLLGFNGVKNPIDSLNNRLSRTVLYFFSIRKLIRYVTDAIERAPDEVAGSFTKLKSTVTDAFARTVVSALGGMQSGVDRLNAALESESGQKFLRGLETAARAAGTVVGYLAEKAASLVEWMGDNFQTVMTMAAVVMALFSAKMLSAAAATAAANLPLFLMIGLVAALVVGLQAAGMTSEEIFSKIGAGAGWLYALVYNLVADAWNLFATFAEFFANVFNDPIGSIARLFVDLADFVLGVLETLVGAIDAVFGSNLASGISGWRRDIQDWADQNLGEKAVTIDRMEKISYQDAMAKGAEKAKSLANSFSDFFLSNTTATAIKSDTSDIAGNINSIKKEVSMSEEDLKSLVDVAERRYVNNINLTAQTPVINISGQNTGHTAADRQNLANAIRDILIEESASGAVRSTARPTAG